MSLEFITFDVWRTVNQSDSGGGEIDIPNVLYAGLRGAFTYVDLSSVLREESGAGAASGPGTLTRSNRVVFLEPWDGSVQVHVDDYVKPNPSVVWLPESMRVVGVRGYPDDAGELQLDVEDVG